MTGARMERIAAILYRIDFPGRNWEKDKLAETTRERYRYIARELMKANAALEAARV